MLAVIDNPIAQQVVDRFAFLVTGWIWLGERHQGIEAVEVLVDDRVVGRTDRLDIRSDVNEAQQLAAKARTGYEIVCQSPQVGRGAIFSIGIRAVFADGTSTCALCSRSVESWGADDRWLSIDPLTTPAAEKQSAATDLGLLPPPHLQVRQVGGVWNEAFYREGNVIARQIAEVCAMSGAPIIDAKSILDFGCGCARVLRPISQMCKSAELWGCDIDSESIAWNQAHLGSLAKFVTTPSIPPTGFANEQFDFIYSVSVFTHLPEELQFAWLTELRRILRPGGLFLASLHGGPCLFRAEKAVPEILARQGFAYRVGTPTDGLPDFYMITFHSETYIRTKWARFFEFVGFKEKYIHGLHDAAIMRRP